MSMVVRKKTLNILVADDDPAICDMLVKLASSMGHECDKVFDGRQCLKRVAQNRYDLLFLDLVLPAIDGDHIVRTLKERMPGLDIIIISAQDDEQIISQTIGNGASAYLVKPFDVAEIKEIMDRISTQTAKGYCDLSESP
jgi:DNA-binding response OmpR family regulator